MYRLWLAFGLWWTSGCRQAAPHAHTGALDPIVVDDTGAPPDGSGDDSAGDTSEWLTRLEARSGRANGATADSPGVRRLLFASSTDGLVYERLDQVLLDQANHPNAVVTDEAMLVYSTAFKPNGERDGEVVSVQLLGGGPWQHYLVEVDGLVDDEARVVEAYPVSLPDGRVRLYFGTTMAGEWSIHAAVSEGGVRFQYEGQCLDPNGYTGHDGGYVDPLVTWIKGEWHMYVTDSGRHIATHARSRDGVTFEIDGSVPIGGKREFGVLSSYLASEDGARLFSSDADGSIGSYWTEDGASLTRELGARLAPSPGALESEWVRHGTVVQLGGRWLMTYMSEIPE